MAVRAIPPLARQLSHDEWRSGEAMAAAMGCTRAAVWKQVDVLRGLGIEILAQRGHGYRLVEPLELLDRDAVLAACGKAAAGLTSLELLAEAGSTNDEILSLPAGRRHGCAVLAEQQTRGRGRHGRHWYSPFARNIYLSLGWRFDTGLRDLAALPLVVAIAASRALHAAGLRGPRIKWPNDLLLNGAKLGGCLVEIQGDVNGPCLAVLGMGVNVRMAGSQQARDIDQPWTDVASHLQEVSRNALAGGLLAELLDASAHFQREGFASFHTEWNRLDAIAGQRVTLHRGDDKLYGTAMGVNAQGALRLNNGTKVCEFTAGEVTFSPC